MYLKAIRIDQSGFPDRDVFPFCVDAFQKSRDIEIATPITFFVGRNGSGKSALLDAVARKGGFLPWGGTKAHRVHGNPYETLLAHHISLEFDQRHPYGFYFRAETFFNFAASLDDLIMDDPQRYQYYGDGSLNVLSHGEAFLSLFRGYGFQLDGLYLMDEPEAALAPETQLEFVKLLLESSRRGNKQYIIATHSPILLGCPGARILSFDEPPIRAVGFRETKHYRFYRDFLNDPHRFLAVGPERSGAQED